MPLAPTTLKAGDVLIFEEMKGPKTGDPADADQKHRHAARLTRVEYGVDPLIKQIINNCELSTPIVEIEWAEEDKLPFPLCISAIGPAPECVLLNDISVVRGNVILVDHGRRLEKDEALGKVATQSATAKCKREERAEEIVVEPAAFHPVLQKRR
jgi:hypothetical protein